MIALPERIKIGKMANRKKAKLMVSIIETKPETLELKG